ncbi:MAG: type II toxin-antitoxin system VapC family toxin [Pyrinomonadaceae bacterium]
MTRKPRAFVLDSWAIMAYLEGEPAAERVANLIADSNEANIPLLISIVNFGEIWYIVARRTSEADAERTTLELRQLGIKIVDINWELTREAAKLKAKHKMSYADSFAAALAKQESAHLVTGDPEFAQVAQEIQITWLK